VEIVHLRKYHWRGGGHGGRSRDAELGRLHGHDAEECDDDRCESYEDPLEHVHSSPGWLEVILVLLATASRWVPY
jgi:hypothetical protein